MAHANAKADRPLSPHLSIYRWPITMAMSIAHRVTGSANYVGAFLFALWLLAVASGPEAYGTVEFLLDSILGKLVLIGFTWSVLHHLLGGLRHLMWDLIIGLDAPWRNRLSSATLIGSVALTAVLWLGILLVG